MNFQRVNIPKFGGAPGVARAIQLPHPSIRNPFSAAMAVTALLAGVYYALISTPMYVSETQFTVRQQLPPTIGTTGTVVSGSSDALSVMADTIAVQQQIHSQEMFNALNKQFNLRAQYSQFRIDPLHWLPAGASDDAFLRFYNHMITVKLDRQSGLVEVDVRSFDRASAQRVAEALLQRTEAFVDGMTQRVREETMRAAQSELARSESQAEAARLAVSNFRGVTSSVDPGAAGAQTLGGQMQFETEASEARADLASALTYNQPNSPIIQQMRAKLAVIETEAGKRRTKQGQGGQGRQVTSYESLIAQRDAAEQRLIAAIASYETTRAMAIQREKYVVRVVNPSRPDRPTEPRRLLDWLTVMVFVLTGYATVSLVIAGIRDHRGI